MKRGNHNPGRREGYFGEAALVFKTGGGQNKRNPRERGGVRKKGGPIE